eukprot:Gb_32788 [translate_table: standard]
MDEVNHSDTEVALNFCELKKNTEERGHLSHGSAVWIHFIFFAVFLYICILTYRSNSDRRQCHHTLILHAEDQTSMQQYGDVLPIRMLLGTNAGNTSLEQDRKTLLALKTFLNERNHYFTGNLYQNWHESDAKPCSWAGITCQTVQGLERVTGINFTGAGLQGELFDGFSALTALSNLLLSQNSFKGEIPLDLGHCRSLVILNLSSNLLEGNLNFTGLSELQVLDISANRLTGNILSAIPTMCNNLTELNLSTNKFTGSIPETLGKCTKLNSVDLSENNLTGPVWPGFDTMEEVSLCCNQLSGNIPEELFSRSCRMQKLDLSANQLNGTIPYQISNCKDLNVLDLSENFLHGKIPSQVGLMQNLNTLILQRNNFSRDIPVQLAECKNLSFLDLSGNNFGGSIQPIFGELKGLQYLFLHDNSYQTSISAGLYNLSTLLTLDISYNNLSGPLPVELASLHALRCLVLAGNKFIGKIPWELGQLSDLQILDLSSNNFTGSIPPSLGNLTNLLWLMLASNSLTGSIPLELGKCSSLLWLNLAYNQLSGPIPEALGSIGHNPNTTFEFNKKYLKPIPRQSGECITLRRWIPANYPPFKFVYDILNRKSCKQFWEKLLKGRALFSICPKGAGNVDQPIISGYLQLTGNKLTGSLPKSIGQMGFLSLALLGLNSFNGQLPGELGNLPLVGLNVSYNNFSGFLPSSLADIECLQNLDLSYNNFSGTIPSSFVKLHDLTKFNISYNPLLTGFVPSGGQFSTFEEDAYLGDNLLCVQHLPNMRKNISNAGKCREMTLLPPPRTNDQQQHSNSHHFQTNVLVITVLASAGIFFCGLLTFLLLSKKLPKFNELEGEFVLVKDQNNGEFSPGKDTMHFFRGKQFTYTDILLATENFSDTHVIGNGGFGTVYEGRLRDGSTVAIKKLQQKGPQGEREFLAEMQTLGSHEFHENLVPLLGCCLFGIEKLLVYDFMSNGSLEDWLYEKNGGLKRLDWPTRYKIALGTAKGLKFLHHDCSPAVIHRDMKASNILLDDDFNPHVTDFGLARFLDVEESHVSTVVAGTLGYVPPEYSQSWRATTKGDVYSYGVVLLELATGKRPLSASDNSDGNLVEWVKMLISHGRAAEALDSILLVKRSVANRESSTPTTPLSSPSSWSVSAEGLQQAQLIRFLHLGSICTDELPNRRPNMRQVLSSLESLAVA